MRELGEVVTNDTEDENVMLSANLDGEEQRADDGARKICLGRKIYGM